LQQLAADPAELGRLLENAGKDASLFSKCESHPLDDKIVIYDAMEDRNFRIRFRLATAYQDERPHNHRFSFTTLILRGVYHQTFYDTNSSLDDELNVDDLMPIYVREDHAGASMTIHHEAIHSTIAPPDTVSLLLRGPAEKRRAIIAHKSSRQIEWRSGETDETPERRASVAMTREQYDRWCARLSEMSLV
jgi:hypothetical protein